MTNCPKCNQEVTNKTKFCPNCGTPLTKGAQAKANQPKPKKSNNARDMIIIFSVLVVIVAGFFILKKPANVEQPQTRNNMNTHPDVGDQGMMNALSQLPTDYNSLIKLGHQTMDQGNYAMAAECYKRALTIDGSDNDIRTDYGACLHGMGLPDRALAEFRKVLVAVPNHTIATFNAGIVFYTLDQIDSAKVYWEKALTLNPSADLKKSIEQYLNDLDK